MVGRGRPGPVFAPTDSLRITLHGRGGPGRTPRSTRSSWLRPRCCGCRPWCRQRLPVARPSWSPWEPATPGRSQTSSPTAPNCCSTCAATTPTCGLASFTRSSASSPLRRSRFGHPRAPGRSDRVGAPAATTPRRASAPARHWSGWWSGACRGPDSRLRVEDHSIDSACPRGCPRSTENHRDRGGRVSTCS